MKNRIKKLEDGRTVFWLDSLNYYVLPEDDLENTLQKIKELTDKHKCTVIAYHAFIILCVVMALSIFFSKCINSAIGTIVFWFVITLELFFIYFPIPLYKIYAHITEDLEKVDSEYKKITTTCFSVMMLGFVVIFFMNLHGAITETFLYKTRFEFKKENYAQATKSLETAIKFGSKSDILKNLSRSCNNNAKGDYCDLWKLYWQKQIEQNCNIESLGRQIRKENDIGYVTYTDSCNFTYEKLMDISDDIGYSKNCKILSIWDTFSNYCESKGSQCANTGKYVKTRAKQWKHECT